MADLLPLPKQRHLQGTTAAAQILAATIHDQPRPASWHDEAWAFRDTTGELRYAEMWLANSLSRVRLVAARRPEGDHEPEPIEDGPAAELVAQLAGGPGGQSALLRAFAVHLLTPGQAFMIGEPTAAGAPRWGVYSADQIRLSTRMVDGQRTYELQTGPEAIDWRMLPPGTLPVKVYRPHPRYSWQPDSPVRGALPILRELSLLTQHVEAQATSRLAGAGVVAMDSNIQFPEGWEKWIEEFMQAITRPIKNRNLAAAVAPFPVRIPVGKGEKIVDKIAHILFATPFDEQSMKLREEQIDRLATAMDMPKRSLTGEQENHWGKWATTEEGITLHVEPNMELICDGLTRGFLDPAMELVGERGGGVLFERGVEGRVLQVRRLNPAPSDFIVWYDTSDLRVRPDRSKDTFELYDRFEATGDDVRGEAGVSEAKPPVGAELERRVLLQYVTSSDPELQWAAGMKLGVLDESDRPAPPTPPQIGAPAGPRALPAAPQDRELPGTREAPAPSDQPINPPGADVAPAIAVVAACDGLVHRALEKAGNRLRQAYRRHMSTDTDCTAVLMHTCVYAPRVRPVEQLLEGAWDRVPEVAAMLGEDPAILQVALDSYVKVLIRTRQPHSWDRLACALGCDTELGCTEAVPA